VLPSKPKLQKIDSLENWEYEHIHHYLEKPGVNNKDACPWVILTPISKKRSAVIGIACVALEAV